MGFFDWLFGRKKKAQAPPPRALKPKPARFIECLQYTFRNEGGFSNVKEDRGGPTNFGITQDTLSRWRGRNVSDTEVKYMDREEAEEIYLKWYWEPILLDRVLDRNVTVAIFDLALWGGLTGASRIVRLSLGFEEHAFDDAPNFTQIMDRLNQAEPSSLIAKMADYGEATRRARVQREPDQKIFLLGWLRRLNRIRKELAGVPEKPIEAWIYQAAGHRPP